ncbi:hypothetical protein G9A89_019995 [Geosiphon pyriformis]|nr:hypothetical protein G9A89_019995 [Geosiphon pyriformis]
MAVRDSFLVTIAGGILLVSVVWGELDSELLVSFGVVFELVVRTDKLFGAVANKLLVAVIDKLEVDILVVDRLVAALLADDSFITKFTAWAWLASSSAASKSLAWISMEASQVSGDCFCVSLFDSGKCVGQAINIIVITKVSQEFCFELIEDFLGLDFAGFENSGFQIPGFQRSGFKIPKSGGGSGNQSPDGVDDHELNLSKYMPYGPNNSVFLCLFWNGNHPNANVMFDVAMPVDVILMTLPDI